MLRAILALWAVFVGGAYGQGSAPSFQTRYSSAFTVAPVGIAFQANPVGQFDITLGASGEYSFRKRDDLGFAFGLGYIPYRNRREFIGYFALKRYETGVAPIGGSVDFSVLGGVLDTVVAQEFPDPVFGLGVRWSSLSPTRFSDLGIQYGIGANAILTGNGARFRLNAFFGLGILFGRTVVINRD